MRNLFVAVLALAAAAPLAAQDASMPGTSPLDLQTLSTATTSSAIDAASLDSVTGKDAGQDSPAVRRARRAKADARYCADLRRAYAARGLPPRPCPRR